LILWLTFRDVVLARVWCDTPRAALLVIGEAQCGFVEKPRRQQPMRGWIAASV
jgi:hypothetical protein